MAGPMWPSVTSPTAWAPPCSRSHPWGVSSGGPSPWSSRGSTTGSASWVRNSQVFPNRKTAANARRWHVLCVTPAGGVFTRQADVVFYPGNERLSIRQQFKGIDEHDHLVVSTQLEGRLPDIPLGCSVQINPYKEIYQYDQNRKDGHASRKKNA